MLGLAKSIGVAETEVHVDDVDDSLTRFANNAIHQNVAERGLTVSVRTALDGRTARATTNRVDEDSLRGAIEVSLSLAHSQPKDPKLLPLPGKQRYRKVSRFVGQTAALTPEDRALAVRRACDLAVKRGQVAAGIFASGQAQTAMGNSRGLFAAYRDTHAEFSITMQEPPAASWGLMINENRVGLIANPWGVLMPAILIALFTIGTNTFTDAVARASLGVGRRSTEPDPLAELTLEGATS